MIRILHIIGAMNRGGAETFLMELYRHIDRSKVQFDFLIYNYTDTEGVFDQEILSLGGKIYEMKQRFYRNPLAYIKELKIFFKNHPEYKIIHSHQNSMAGYSLSVAKTHSKALTISHSHSAFVVNKILRKYCNKIGRILLHRYADFFFGCSNAALMETSNQKVNNQTHFIVKNAIDIDKFTYSDKMRDLWRKQLGANKYTFILGNVARFTSEKNHKHIIQTFAELNKKRKNSLLVLIGDGPRLSECKVLAESLNISDKIKFLGVRSDVENIINSFDAFILPSFQEGLGIVLIESQTNGLPCVISADVIPDEADTGAGLVTRMSLNDSPQKWAETCLNIISRKRTDEVKQTIINSGYEINTVANWLQNFYIKHWN